MEDFFPILIAAVVILLVWVIGAVVANVIKGEKRKLSERLSGTSGNSGQVSPAASITVQDEEEGLSPFLSRFPVARRMHRWLVHAYPEASLVKFLVIACFGSLITGFLALSLFDSPLIGFAGAGVAAYLPVMVVNGKKNKRQKILSMQLPEALDFLQRILRAGHSLSTGLAMMAEELPQPLSSEFRRCYDQHSLGQPLEDSLRQMAKRIESTDFAFFVTAVLIQRQTGGDLSQVLGNISGMIRQRIRLQQYVKAKTAEGRFTGYILVAFPIMMFFIAYTMNPDYGKILLHTSSGLMLLGIAVTLVVLGLVAIRKITTVKV